ncbi:hypothetical protein K503DRAFT_802671 [Rhizopogon vinicolor AM-OR11-026]|uniref:Uncharacterized protein n=1 Tax=Rhizopogon vinicolor AM-OR11-026 TaxID=1314800 RepID=A0A1B7MSR9_9AGAM|nr:hypothetical protein K503DRAFT_802671 [Rhizopogon vinicolor AM-OR11-026]
MMDTFTIADLRKEDVAKQFSAISTLYTPPRDEPHNRAEYSVKGTGPKLNIVAACGPHECGVIVQIDTHVAQEGHKKFHTSSTMKKFMTDLALKPKFLEEYELDPVAVVESAKGLSDLEKFGLKFARGGPTDALMEATESNIASGRQLAKDEITKGRGPLGLQIADIIIMLLINMHIIPGAALYILLGFSYCNINSIHDGQQLRDKGKGLQMWQFCPAGVL